MRIQDARFVKIFKKFLPVGARSKNRRMGNRAERKPHCIAKFDFEKTKLDGKTLASRTIPIKSILQKIAHYGLRYFFCARVQHIDIRRAQTHKIRARKAKPLRAKRKKSYCAQERKGTWAKGEKRFFQGEILPRTNCTGAISFALPAGIARVLS